MQSSFGQPILTGRQHTTTPPGVKIGHSYCPNLRTRLLSLLASPPSGGGHVSRMALASGAYPDHHPSGTRRLCRNPGYIFGQPIFERVLPDGVCRATIATILSG